MDNTIFNSDWDIDQLVFTGSQTITAPSGLNAYQLITFSQLTNPVYWITYQLSGSNYWHTANAPGEQITPTNSPGLDSTLGVSVAGILMANYLNVQINNNNAGSVTLTVRYYIDKDKVTY